MPTLQASGTQAATIGTEHTLADISAPGVYIFKVDKTNMADGDITELRVKIVILTGGSLKGLYFKRVIDVPVADDMIETSVPIDNDLSDNPSVRFTLKQTNGTGRSYDWKVIKL